MMCCPRAPRRTARGSARSSSATKCVTGPPPGAARGESQATVGLGRGCARRPSAGVVARALSSIHAVLRHAMLRVRRSVLGGPVEQPEAASREDAPALVAGARATRRAPVRSTSSRRLSTSSSSTPGLREEEVGNGERGDARHRGWGFRAAPNADGDGEWRMTSARGMKVVFLNMDGVLVTRRCVSEPREPVARAFVYVVATVRFPPTENHEMNRRFGLGATGAPVLLLGSWGNNRRDARSSLRGARRRKDGGRGHHGGDGSWGGACSPSSSWRRP